MNMLPNPKSENFPSQLRRERKNADFTLTELAESADISNVMPGRYERGEAVPTMQTWQKLNEALFGAEAEGDEIPSFESSLETATVEELVEELKTRGATKVNLIF